MKQNLQKIGIVLFILSSLSCSKSDNNLVDGKWKDNIKLSQKTAQFSTDEDSIIITTEGNWWWIAEISLDGNSNFNIPAIDTTQSDFVIQADEFSIERRNSKELLITMTANPTKQERVLRITLEAGDYFDGIVITKSAN